MCKLCGSYEYPICFKTHPRLKRSNESKEFCNMVEQYTGEYPCELCNKVYVNALKRSHKITCTLDNYIIKKLFYHYKHPQITNGNHNKILTDCRKKYNDTPYVYTKKHKPTYVTIESNILAVTNSKSTTYHCAIQKNFNLYTKRFKTLEEAQQFKQGVLNGDYQHNSVAA